MQHAGLGAYLREHREARGLSLDDLSAATRIVPRLLRALEEDWLGDPATQENLPAGAVREWRSMRGFGGTLGNAGGASLELDGVALPPLGESGQVVRDVPIPRESAS